MFFVGYVGLVCKELPRLCASFQGSFVAIEFFCGDIGLLRRDIGLSYIEGE